jgi:hypothetical protein
MSEERPGALPPVPPNRALGLGMPSIRNLSLGDNPHGYHEETGPAPLGSWGSVHDENDTYTCQHGGGHIVIVRRDTPQAWCKRCGGMVCEYHAQFGACHPELNPNNQECFEIAENRRLFRQMIDGR